jgi:hypothetical protein
VIVIRRRGGGCGERVESSRCKRLPRTAVATSRWAGVKKTGRFNVAGFERGAHSLCSIMHELISFFLANSDPDSVKGLLYVAIYVV